LSCRILRFSDAPLSIEAALLVLIIWKLLFAKELLFLLESFFARNYIYDADSSADDRL